MLLAAREQSLDRLAIFSGQRLDVDPARGLVGECDFILAVGPAVPPLRVLLATVVEAKKNDVEAGLGPCVAQMVAARETWQFLRLDGPTAQLDRRRLYLDNVGGILGTLREIVAAVDPAGMTKPPHAVGPPCAPSRTHRYPFALPMTPLPADAYRRIDTRGLTAGSCYLDELLLTPRDVVTRFGPPAEGDGLKVSGCYTFVREPGIVFTLYDWKLTSLYERGNGLEEGHPDASLPTPEAFWATEVPEQLNIGGFEDRGDVGHFRRWLLQQVG